MRQLGRQDPIVNYMMLSNDLGAILMLMLNFTSCLDTTFLMPFQLVNRSVSVNGSVYSHKIK